MIMIMMVLVVMMMLLLTFPLCLFGRISAPYSPRETDSLRGAIRNVSVSLAFRPSSGEPMALHSIPSSHHPSHAA